MPELRQTKDDREIMDIKGHIPEIVVIVVLAFVIFYAVLYSTGPSREQNLFPLGTVVTIRLTADKCIVIDHYRRLIEVRFPDYSTKYLTPGELEKYEE